MESSTGPDFVLFGFPCPSIGEVAILASSEIKEAHFTGDMMQEDAPGRSLRAQMGRTVIGYGETYADAFEDLFRRWRPDNFGELPSGAPGLPEGKLAIEGEVIELGPGNDCE